jgi:hypothetical protein
MKFTFHYPYVILELVPNTVIFSNNATLLLRLLQDLPVYMSSTVCVLYETGTAYPSRAHLFSFLPPVVCGRVHVLLYFCVVSSDIQHFVISYVFAFGISCCDVRHDFHRYNDVVLVFIASCLEEDSCLIYVICVWA